MHLETGDATASRIYDYLLLPGWRSGLCGHKEKALRLQDYIGVFISRVGEVLAVEKGSRRLCDAVIR